MNTTIDTLINLDTNHYRALYKDVQDSTKGMSETDAKLWILTHFVKHGYSEKRKYRLKSEQVHETHTSKRTEKHAHTPEDIEKDVQKLIEKFRKHHGGEQGGVRDRHAGEPNQKSLFIELNK